jgi:hypothetical protein
MARFHVTQDETGYYQLTFENDAGELTLVSHQFASPDHLIKDAQDLIATGDYGDALIVVAAPRPAALEAAAAGGEYKRPAPRRAGE